MKLGRKECGFICLFFVVSALYAVADNYECLV